MIEIKKYLNIVITYITNFTNIEKCQSKRNNSTKVDKNYSDE